MHMYIHRHSHWLYNSDCSNVLEYHDEQKEMEMKARWRPVVKQEVKQEVQSSPSHDYTPTDQQQHSRTRNHRHDSDSSPERQHITSHRYVCTIRKGKTIVECKTLTVEKSDEFDEWMSILQNFPCQTFALNRLHRYMRWWTPPIHQSFARQTF